jgi:hypothetical protein
MPSTTEQVLARLVDRMENRYYGKYRGIVRDTADPEGLGRLRALVPSVLGPDVLTGWAVPCVPYGGASDTGTQLVPEVGAGVWVEFEEGDLEFPIWAGTFWSRPGGRTEAPPAVRADGTPDDEKRGRPAVKIIRTAKGHTLQLDDTDAAERIALVEGAHHHVITLDDQGVTIRDGVSGHRIVLGRQGVEIRDGNHPGNRLTMDAAGTTVADAHGNQVVLGAAGIQIGAGATEAMVLGSAFATIVSAFMVGYRAHTHPVAGGVASAPTPPLTALSVPLSTRNQVGA